MDTKELTNNINKILTFIETYDTKIESNKDNNSYTDIINDYTQVRELLTEYIKELYNITKNDQSKLLNKKQINDKKLINKNTVKKLIKWCEIMMQTNKCYIVDRRKQCCISIDKFHYPNIKYDNKVLVGYNKNLEEMCSRVCYFYSHSSKDELYPECYKIYENKNYALLINTQTKTNYNQHQKILESVKEYIINNNIIYSDI